ncbi:uncharacterized protein LOC121368106 [Gigantopelta aegis]|uniref:uncharacterized protein LOC121368106 n=1 Tax=Gigantopelta aegis TaxID=1735272 RepID=UPI001B8883FD|nr:uncharacterized protein LOC121368106 [Gigantopelta aegis]XP_041348620.1 uncharacterized protein LOC121368106 [Gigantopelta aegis]XP_041348626.1 uncharacterized protein LOC121368106 [Gigantopelta aegis]
MLLLTLSFLNLIALHELTEVSSRHRAEAPWTYDSARKMCVQELVTKDGVAMTRAYRLRQIAVRRDQVRCIYEQCTTEGMKPYKRRNMVVAACWDRHAKRCRRVHSEFYFYNLVAIDCGTIKCDGSSQLEVKQEGCYDKKTKRCFQPNANQTTVDETGVCTFRECQSLGPLRVGWTESFPCPEV